MAKLPSKTEAEQKAGDKNPAAKTALTKKTTAAKTVRTKNPTVTKTAPAKNPTKKSVAKFGRKKSAAKATKSAKSGDELGYIASVVDDLRKLKRRWRNFRKDKVQPHRSFRRSHREDYVRQTKAPGLLSHAMTTFQIIFRHWKTFIPFILLMTFAYIILVGLLSEDVYQQFQDSINETSESLANGRLNNFARAGLLLVSTVTTGGLNSGMDDTQMVFMILLFLIMWMVTIYLMRHFMAGGKPKLRDGLYNALTPFISTLVVFVVIFIQMIPLMLVIITYSAAKATDFLSTPFYALVYFIFAALMILITTYLLSSSLMALVAVTAPGLYPMKALFAASDLMNGRRTKLIVRVLYLFLVIALVYIIVMMPVILVDLWLKGMWDWLYGVPIVPFFLLLVTCFVFIYATTYLYRYYRWLLDYQEK